MSATATTIRRLLIQVVKHIRADMEQRFSKAGLDITGFQYLILVHTQQYPATVSDLARHMHIKPPSLVPAVRRLVAQEYLVRTIDAHDHRKIHLRIAAAGSALLKRVPLMDSSGVLDHALQQLGARQRTQLVSLLEQLVAAFPNHEKA